MTQISSMLPIMWVGALALCMLQGIVGCKKKIEYYALGKASKLWTLSKQGGGGQGYQLRCPNLIRVP